LREISVRIIPKYSPGINQAHYSVKGSFFFYYILYSVVQWKHALELFIDSPWSFVTFNIFLLMLGQDKNFNFVGAFCLFVCCEMPDNKECAPWRK
jgi:hypothetical protein